MENGFNLSFQEAINKIFEEGGFIQGSDFASGIYVGENRNTQVLEVRDANHTHIKIMDFAITRGVVKQKYRYLSVATTQALSK